MEDGGTSSADLVAEAQDVGCGACKSRKAACTDRYADVSDSRALKLIEGASSASRMGNSAPGPITEQRSGRGRENR